MEINKLFNVKDKTVLITGGSRGIGLYIAQGFVVNGANVFIVSRNFETCKKTAEQLTRAGPGKCTALKGDDLSTQAACQAVAKELAQHTQKLHVLVNNSGTSWGGPFEKYEEKGWDKVMALNVKGVFYLTQSLAPYLQAAGTKEDPARVINVGSVAGVFPQKVPTYAYDLSKASVHHLTIKLAAELGPRCISVNAIAPGFVPSKMSNQLLTYGDEGLFADMTALGRIGNPNDMAGVVLFLSSQAGAWVTGAIIQVDGGQLVKPASGIECVSASKTHASASAFVTSFASTPGDEPISLRKVIVPIQSLAKTYWSAGAFWGFTAGAAALFAFQPYAIWTRIPLIGRHYRDDVYEALLEKKKKDQLAEIQAEYEKLHAEAAKK